MPRTDLEPGVDGRTARAQRTRAAVVDALLGIIEEGDARPTAPRIAARAGVSLRSIYQHFADREQLFEAVTIRQVARAAESMTPVPADLPLAERVAGLARQRAEVLEFLTPLQRARMRYLSRLPSAHGARDRMLARGRREIVDIFGRELGGVPRPVRNDVLDALDASSSWPVWDYLRSRLGADHQRAVTVLERLLLDLVRHGPVVAPAASSPVGRRAPALAWGPKPSSGRSVDGRVARGERSRAAVVATVLDLIGAGDLRPTAQRIADRAGVSLRSVFHHFEDMEALYAAAADLHAVRVVPSVSSLPSGGPLDERIDAFVSMRCRVMEASTPIRRAARLVEPESHAVLERLRAAVAFWRVVMLESFAPEVEADPSRGDPLSVVTSWEFWDALRNQQRVSVARAERVVHRAVSALVYDLPA